jgi:hypothetical protein
MKTIQRPADIAITNQGRPILKEDKAPFTMSFRDFLSVVFENDARCQQTFANVRACGRIDAAALKEGDTIELADEDFVFLADLIGSTALPTLPLADGSRLPIGKQLMAFMEAIEAAT